MKFGLQFLRRTRVFFPRLSYNQLVKQNVPAVHLLSAKYQQTEDHQHLKNNIKYLFYFTSAVVAYKLFNNNKSAVDAAIPVNNKNKFNFIADVVEKVSPAVVYIEIKDTRRVEFFSGKPTTVSNGSGFIIKEDGLILTNAHVVTNKPYTKVEVKLQNGKVYSGLVEDIDVRSDLATVRINAKNLPTLTLGNSSELRPGEFVVALGSPLSLSNTVTAGVVSSTHRGSDELGLHGKDMVYIQTDAAITFGNSGGPLVNLNGEAIGVNSMKVTAGISFAIPSDYVKDFLKKSSGVKKTPQSGPKKRFMGITMLTITPQILYELRQRSEEVPNNLENGVLVMKVIYGSPAHLGGLHPGDIVISINEKLVHASSDIYTLVADGNIKTLKMKIIRFGKVLDIHIQPEDIEQ